VLLPSDDYFHLTYCTNIHPADGWDAVFTNLSRYAPVLKARLSPSGPFGVGLRLSAREARELLEASRLDAFRAFLDREGLYVAIINGFPHGAFHGTVVKAQVYAPDWRDEARVSYTCNLIEIMRRLVPGGLDGGISTAPLSYKAWMMRDDRDAWETVTQNVARVAEALVRVKQDHGALIHLDVEPEPDCSIENTDETLEFFERHLLESGAQHLARSLGVGDEAARDCLREHIRVCFDCCHFAVEYEDAAAALDRLSAAGIRIGRVQLSSAIHVAIPDDPEAANRVTDRLRIFADPIYLHQVVEQRGGTLRRYRDLDEALRRATDAAGRQWRIHFHVPLFTSSYDGLGSTQDYVASALQHILRHRLTRHLEIETYTWDVLPPGLKLDLPDSIAREYEWVLGVTGRW
jgi:sugar phosphate isomerase/epimerase